MKIQLELYVALYDMIAVEIYPICIDSREAIFWDTSDKNNDKDYYTILQLRQIFQN